MKLDRSTIFFFLFLNLNLISQNFYKQLYKSSSNIFTGYIKNIHIYSDSTKKMIDIEITEIQKGKAYKKFLLNVSMFDTFELNKEYIFFLNKDKKNKNYRLIYSEEVCKECENKIIKEIYKIVNKRPLARIKAPRQIQEYKKCKCW